MTEHTPVRDEAAMGDANLDLALRIPIAGIQLLEASAGTGKTFTVATLYSRLVIELGLPVSRLLAVTFTEAATKDLREQLRGRLLNALKLLERDDPIAALRADSADHAHIALAKRLLVGASAREGVPALLARLRRAAEQMDLAPIHTIHGFCQRALRDHALVAGRPLTAYDVLLDESELRHEVALEFWREHSRAQPDAQTLLSLWSSPKALAGFLRDAMALDGLLPPPEPPTSESAQAGDALRAARIALAAAFAKHGDEAHASLLAACADKSLNAGSVKASNIARAWDALRHWSSPADDDPSDGKLATFSSSMLAKRTNKNKTTPQSPLFDAVQAWVEAAEANEQSQQVARIAMIHAARDFAIARCAALKQSRGLMGFDDMIRGVHTCLARDVDGGFAAALQRQYAIALVDEFQDTDPRQWDIFRRLFGQPANTDADADANVDADAYAMSDGDGDGDGDGDTPRALFLIGDPKQAIYRFRGGDVATYLQAQSEAAATHTLRRNFRSRPRALAATEAMFTLRGPGAFDQPGIAFEPVEPGGSCNDDALRIDGADAPALVLLPVREDPLDTSIDRSREAATAACVAAIHSLLSAAQAGRAVLTDRHGTTRAVAPGDISVLVPRHRDGEAVQRALSARGIPSVSAGRLSLYQTDEATHLCWLLEALLAPADDGRLRAALATPLFGLDAAQIAAFDTDLPSHRIWQDKLEHWQERVRRHGPMALVGELCEAQAARLLGWPDGERRVSNYLQLAEALQSGVDRAPGLAGLLADLETRIAQAEDVSDEDLLRLESDSARVRIMTLHVSKGLTLDLVFLPFAATSSGSQRAGKPPMARHHIGLDRLATLYPDKDDPATRQETRETRAEQIRLLYVGLTRARLATWIGWGAVKDAHKTALGWLLHRPAGAERANDSAANDGAVDDGAVDDSMASVCAGDDGMADDVMVELAKLDDNAVQARLHELQALAPDAIAIAPAVTIEAVDTLPRLRFVDAVATPPARVPLRQYDRDWWVYSFSQLAREEGLAEAQPADDERDVVTTLDYSRYAGPRFGNALHRALERVDFAAWLDWRGPAPPTGQFDAVVEALAQHGFDTEGDRSEGVTQLSALIGETLNAPMPEGTRLALLPAARRIAEMEFHLSLAPVTVDALLATLHAHGLVQARHGFGLRQRIEGLLTGFIDLVYEADGRHYVLDYKSNQLPGYDHASLQRAVRDAEYDLQYVLYSLALHRWLQFRMGADYDIARHLGGVRYVFSRGLDRNDPARPGLHAVTLPPAFVLALDALLRHRPAA